MADFSIAFPIVISGEGYYVSQEFWRAHHDEVSGETYMGIDRIQNPNWAGWPIIDEYKAEHGAIPYNTRLPLSLGLEPLVMAVAKTKYWDTFLGDQINNQDTANLIAEIDFMSGSFGIKQVQGAVNTLIAPQTIDVDGEIGTTTMGYINRLPYQELYAKIYNTRKAWYQAKQQQGSANAAGWLKRLAQLPATLN